MNNKTTKQPATVGQYIEKYQDKILTLLPKLINPVVFINLATNEIRKSAKLRDCTPISLINSLIGAATLGLIPGSLLGQAYLVPFKDNKSGRLECTLIPGYRGFIKLMYNSGKVAKITADVVLDGDHFEYSYGTNEFLTHVPLRRQTIDAQIRGINYAYCLVKLTTGETIFKVLTSEDILKHRSYAKTDKFWGNYPEEMSKKTAIRVLSKLLPQESNDLAFARAVQVDVLAHEGNQAATIGSVIEEALPSPVSTQSTTQQQTRTEQLVNKITEE
jgi:recombination protein RecT